MPIQSLTLDKKRSPLGKRIFPNAAERAYQRALRGVAKQIGLLIGAFEPGDLERLPRLTDMLRRYSEALTPWAEQTAGRMIQQVNIADEAAWRQMGEQLSAGVTPGYVRLSIGIEHIEDILGDLDQALNAAGGRAQAAE